MERYSGSHVLCPRRVLLIYPPRPYPSYLNLSPHPPLDHSYSFQSSRHHSLILVGRNAAQQIRRVQRPS
ncbi:hypothetical protein HBI59_090930 [Parastagonospora nodorum]|nr:hypothetical protein HBI59_090930 [Parastagonospora nodorum]